MPSRPLTPSPKPNAKTLLVHALRYPETAPAFTLPEWDLLIRQARHADLLGCLGALIKARGFLDQVALQPRQHLISALRVAGKIAQTARWEVQQVRTALAPLNAPVVILKGAAYTLMDLPIAPGRLFYDVDVMVPESSLAQAELLLKLHGWGSVKTSAYDQRYYRQWMHELPPMQHAARETMLDLHHNILPRTARFHPDAEQLLHSARAVGGDAQLRVLAPHDMVLHSATHLFHEGESHHALRDLFDLDGLLRHFGADAAFWSGLVQRAQQLELARPLYYALRYTQRIFATPIPPEVCASAHAGEPDRLTLALMDTLCARGFRTPHPSCNDWLTPAARFALYVRGHWLRMPLHRLIPHLVHQTFAPSSAD